MKIPYDNLHELIHSLSDSERKAFKRFAARRITEGQSTYEALFDAIAAQEVYDEESIKQQFKGKVTIKRIYNIKSYLYKLILKSLVEQEETIPNDFKIRHELNELAVLTDKALYRQADKLLTALKSKIVATEQYAFLLQLLPIEKDIARAISPNYTQYLVQYRNEYQSTIKNLYTLSEYHIIYISMYRLNHLYLSKEQFQQDIQEVSNNFYFNDISYATTDYLQAIYWYNKAKYYILLKDYEQSLVVQKKAIAIWGGKTIWHHELHEEYVDILLNYSQLCRLNKEYEEALRIIVELKKEMPESKEDKYLHKFTYLYSFELHLLLNMGNFDTAECLINSEVKLFYAQYGDRMWIRVKCDFCTLATLIYFETKQYNKALTWNAEIADAPTFIQLHGFYVFHKTMHLIIHFELHNYQYLDYEITNTLRLLKKYSLKYPVDYHLIEQLKKIVTLLLKQGSTQKTKENAIWQELQAWLEKQKSSPYFNYLKWVKSKLA